MVDTFRDYRFRTLIEEVFLVILVRRAVNKLVLGRIFQLRTLTSMESKTGLLAFSSFCRAKQDWTADD